MLFRSGVFFVVVDDEGDDSAMCEEGFYPVSFPELWVVDEGVVEGDEVEFSSVVCEGDVGAVSVSEIHLEKIPDCVFPIEVLGRLSIVEGEEEGLYWFVMPGLYVLGVHSVGVVEPSVGLDVDDGEFFEGSFFLEGCESRRYPLVVAHVCSLFVGAFLFLWFVVWSHKVELGGFGAGADVDEEFGEPDV